MKTVKKVKTSSAVKVAAVSPLIRLADVGANVDKCIEEVKRSSELGAKVLLFPELTFSGVTCFDLYLHSAFVESIEKGLERFINSTAQLDVMSFVSVPVSVGAECYCCTAAVYHGELLGLSPKSDLSPEESRYFDTPTEENLDLFYAGRKTTLAKDIIFIAPFDKNIKISVSYTEGANLIVDPFASAETVERAAKLPNTEAVLDHGFDVLLCTDDVDEFCLQILRVFKEKSFKNVGSGNLELETEAEKEAAKVAAEENKGLLTALKDALGDKVKEVRMQKV